MGSGQIADSQESSIEVNVDVLEDGNISFAYRVSSEYSPSGSNFYDGLTFYIDNQQVGQYQPTGSGESPWTTAYHSVSSGNHTFKWTYSKDGGGGSTDCSNTGCDDAAYIDDITFPSVESQGSGVVGDVNGDEEVNVLDVIQTVNMALGSQDPDYSTADLNNDGIINILDIVQIVNIVLDERVSDAQSATINIYQDNIEIISDGGLIAGIQMTLKHEDDFSFDLTEDCMVSQSYSTNGQTTLIVVLPQNNHIMTYSGDFEISELIVANSYEEIEVSQPSTIELSSAYPNPFNPITTLDLYLSSNDYVSITVYDVNGSKVGTIINKSMESGSHQIHWDASGLPSGIYFVKALTSFNAKTQKVTLIK